MISTMELNGVRGLVYDYVDRKAGRDSVPVLRSIVHSHGPHVRPLARGCGERLAGRGYCLGVEGGAA